jgi:hypothetical protein
MHAFVATILLRVAGFDEFGVDAQADSADAQRRQAGESAGGERHAVAGASDLGEAELLKEAPEHRLDADVGGGIESLTAEQEAVVAIATVRG